MKNPAINPARGINPVATLVGRVGQGRAGTGKEGQNSTGQEERRVERASLHKFRQGYD